MRSGRISDRHHRLTRALTPLIGGRSHDNAWERDPAHKRMRVQEGQEAAVPLLGRIERRNLPAAFSLRRWTEAECWSSGGAGNSDRQKWLGAGAAGKPLNHQPFAKRREASNKGLE